MHSILVLGKEAKVWYYIKYSIPNHVLVLLVKGCKLFRNFMCDATH